MPVKTVKAISKIKIWMGALGISGAVVLSGAAYAVRYIEQSAVRPYVTTIVREQFDSLHAPFDNKLQNVCYDSKLIRNILELTVSDSIVMMAKKKIDENTWKLH